MAALGVMATAKKRINVLQHLLGFFETGSGPAKRELLGLIEDYARSLVPH